MAFRHVAGTAIVPLFSRIVLAAAFVTVGSNKIFEFSEFSGAEAQRLAEAGVEAEPVGAAPAESAAPEGDAEARADGAIVRPAAFVQEAEARDAAERAADAMQDAGDAAQDAAGDAAEGSGDAAGDAAPSAAAAIDPDATYTARSLHRITLLVHGEGWPAAKYLAWLAAITEFVGGAAVLLGLLTRFWATGLAIAMGVAFYLVSMGIYNVHTMSPFEFALEIPRYNTVVSQLSLFVLAFGLLLTGAGPVSIDRIIFGGGSGVPKDAPGPAPTPAPQHAAPYAATPPPTQSAPAAAAPAPTPAPVQPAPLPVDPPTPPASGGDATPHAAPGSSGGSAPASASTSPAGSASPSGGSMPPQPKRVVPPPAPVHPDAPPPSRP